MKTINGKRMCKILETKGWELARVTGSHQIFVKADSNMRLSVPVHGKRDLKIGLQKTIMKLPEVKEDEL